MKEEPVYLQIAAQMMETTVEDLREGYPALVYHLSAINGLARKAGGGLYSRQVIAMLVAPWVETTIEFSISGDKSNA